MQAGTKMKAVYCTRPTDLDRLEVSEIDAPALTDDGVLVRVRASSANPVDLFPASTAGYLMGGRKPCVLGSDFSGTVEAAGRDVTGFAVGDEVFGGARGAFAELMTVRSHGAMVHKPAGVSHEQAGTVAVAGTTALQAVRDHGRIQPGQRVLINGASGGVGTFAVQIARALGGEVTAVCSPRNVDMARSLGATNVIDYTKADFTRSGESYDLLLDIAGTHSLSACRRVMKPEATFVGVGAAGLQHARAGALRALGVFGGNRIGAIFGRHRVVAVFVARLNVADLTFLGDLMTNGSVTPVIDRRYDLGSVREALAYLNEGHARGKIAIKIAGA